MTVLQSETVTSELKRLQIETSFELSPHETNATQKAWDRIIRHHPWAHLLPPTTGLLVDAKWSGSAGYWESELRLATDPQIEAVLLAQRAFQNPRDLPRVLAHELTHLIQWHASPKTTGWMREASALLAEVVVTGTTNPTLFAAWDFPTTNPFVELALGKQQLKNHWRAMLEKVPQYGQLLELFRYLDRICFADGSRTLLDAIALEFDRQTSSPDPLKSLWPIVVAHAKPLEAAREAGLCESFERFFERFHRARFTQRISPSSLDYVSEASGRAHSVELADLPSPLPPYSAASYYSNEDRYGVPACRPGELDLPVDPGTHKRRCLRIRFAK